MTATPEATRKALVAAIWECIVDASSMNVVMSGAEVNAAIREFRICAAVASFSLAVLAGCALWLVLK